MLYNIRLSYPVNHYDGFAKLVAFTLSLIFFRIHLAFTARGSLSHAGIIRLNVSQLGFGESKSVHIFILSLLSIIKFLVFFL